jgi:hypothetical protein
VAADPQLHLQPTTRPGAKIPHAWLVDKRGIRVSTLDVTGKGCFSLVTGLAGGAWSEAVHELDLPYLRAVVIGQPGAPTLLRLAAHTRASTRPAPCWCARTGMWRGAMPSRLPMWPKPANYWPPPSAPYWTSLTSSRRPALFAQHPTHHKNRGDIMNMRHFRKPILAAAMALAPARPGRHQRRRHLFLTGPAASWAWRPASPSS